MTKAQAEKLIAELLEFCGKATKGEIRADMIHLLPDVLKELRELTLLSRQLP